MTKIIDAHSTNRLLDVRELWRYRDLLFTLAWRDFKVRYAQTTVGLLWAIIQPVATIAILSLVFGKLVGIKTEMPHLLFTISGMCMWTYFSYVMTNSGNSIIGSQEMVKKIYFPRLIIPLSKAIVGLIDLGITIAIFIVLSIYFGYQPKGSLYMAPVYIILTIVASLSVGIWLSALTVRYRDFQHVIPFLVQLGLYITPVAYPAKAILNQLPTWAQQIYFLNPMAGIVEGFRNSLFGGDPLPSESYISFGMTFILLITGIWYFQKIEDQMADYV